MVSEAIEKVRLTNGKSLGQPKSPYFKKEPTLKDNEFVLKLFDRTQNQENGIFATMQQQPYKPNDGKKSFLDKINISDAKNMHPIDTYKNQFPES
jgi:hypothetical protein